MYFLLQCCVFFFATLCIFFLQKTLREMIKEIEKLIEEMMETFLLKEEDLELEIVKLM